MRSLSSAGADILTKHSINSLLEQRQDFLTRRNETADELITPLNEPPIAINDFLGFGKSTTNPLLLGTNGDTLSTSMAAYTPLTPSSSQSSASPGTMSANSFDIFQFENVAQNNTPLKVFQRNISFDCSAPLSPSTPTTIYNRSFLNSPLVSDGSNSSSANGLSVDSIPLMYQNNFVGNGIGGCLSNSRSNSPESQNSNQSNVEHNLIDMINLLSVAENNDAQMSLQQQQQLSTQLSQQQLSQLSTQQQQQLQSSLHFEQSLPFGQQQQQQQTQHLPTMPPLPPHVAPATPPLYQTNPLHQHPHVAAQQHIPPLPSPNFPSTPPQNIPFGKRTASRESIRSMAFLNSGPPAYNLNYHTPPDSETTM
uniref:Uncharacterized protein n=1 Tax=Zeugodacus cucurbitae TaxID=28588 RepID=A0A0A1X9E0_ZEUCU